MSSQHDGEIKKPTPRRLFSIDNLKSFDSSNKKRAPQPQESPSWTTSPEDREQLTSSPVQDAPPASQTDFRKVLPFVITHTPRSGSADSGSLSRWESLREHVLAAGTGRAATPPLLPPSLPFSQSQRSRSPYGQQQPTSAAPSTLSLPASSSLPTTRPPSRSQTPKPGSRLAAKLGFRSVVDHAREIAVDENRKLSEDILKACWATRHINPDIHHHQLHPGSGKANFTASSSGLHLPFTKTTMSSFATAASGSAVSVATGFSSKKSDQPQSHHGSTSYSYSNPFSSSSALVSGSSVNVASSSGGGGQYAGSSVKLLHRVLWQASGSTTATLRSVYLPHENLVLFALLTPFLILSSHVQGANVAYVEEERWLAIDAFELLVKTWPPANETASAERCLWCTKAAVSPPSPLRSRILSTLWGLTTPNENNHIFLSPDAIQSLANGLFTLLPVIASQSSHTQLQSDYQSQLQGGGMRINLESDSAGDLKILKEVMDHLSEGPVDEDALEVEYDVKWDTHGRDNAESARKLMLSESCVCCLEMCERDARIWLMQHAVEDYWPQLSEHPTQLQRSVFSRYIIHFCNGALSLLTLPPYEIRHDLRTALMNKIIHALEKLVIPEVGSVHDKGKAKDRGESREGETRDVRFEMRKAVARLVVEVLCYDEDVHDESARWAVGVIVKWWSDAVWKEAFEKMLINVVVNAEWGAVVHVLTGVVDRVSDGIRKVVVTSIFSHLTDRLVQDPPPPALLTQLPESSQTHPHNRSSSALSYTSYNQYSTHQPTNNLTTLLHTISQLAPQIFFRPLFALAASNRELTIASVLCVVCMLERIVKDWWVRDADMIGVALMNEVGASNDDGSGQGKAGKLGQVVVLIELVGRLRVLRRLRDSVGSSSTGSSVLATALGSDAARLNLTRFVTGLEMRLAALIEAKEKVSQIPPTQRMLFCVLFREFRLLTRSLKPAPWLPTVLRWFEECYEGGDHDEEDQEVKMRLEEIQALYELAKGNASSSHKRRTFAMMPTTTTTSSTKDKENQETEEPLHVPDILNTRLKFIASLFKGFVPHALKLLVTVSALLNPAEWGRIAPIIWPNGLDTTGSDSGGGMSEKGVIPLICFLVMQCAEKNPLEFRTMVEVDMRSSDDRTRLESVNKLSLLINWRFQIMPEPHTTLADRTHRIFKLARPPLPFVPADMGSVNYVHDDDSINTGTKGKDGIPPELRRQLIEIGWVGEDMEGDEKEVWVRTPVSMLPVSQVERLDLQRSDHPHRHHTSRPPSPSVVPNSPRPVSPSGQLNTVSTASPNLKPDEGGLLRRNSSTGGPTYAKRRAVFVPALSPAFRGLAMMVYDTNYATATAARETLLDLMRNDPGLLLRPILDLLCEEGQENIQKDVSQAVNIFTALLHTKHMLPPPMTHAIFNNLAGFLKYASRQTDPSISTSQYLERGPGQGESSLTSFAATVPIMAQLAKYVGELTIREIRRSKMEHFLIPYGTLWFNHVGMHSGPMFPKNPSPNFGPDMKRRQNPFDVAAETALDTKLVSVVMIRIAQNMMFVDMLKKNAQDVALVRKTMPRFVVPRLDGNETEGDEKILDLNAFVPFRKLRSHSSNEGNEKAVKTLEVLSLALARSYVTLMAQVFRCMSRNSNDREEMANFVDGLNRILLVHGDDIGIIGHVLIAFMVASARFRRLFTSGGGYALFVPALVKTYADFYDRIDIKLAIEYAVYRFYALHREAFLFQSLDAIAHVAALPETNIAQYAARVYELFYSLRTGVTPTNIDPAGIHDINQSQEREAMLIHVAEDKPQTLLAAIRRGDTQTNGQIFFDVPDSLGNSRLRMEDLVKLFLTIIAHDPSILRAQHFMRIFRFLAPHLYNASPQARSVLQDGLVALSEILLRTFSKSKLVDGGNATQVGEVDVVASNTVNEPEPTDKSKNASNPNTMRLDFLFALTTVAQAGSHIPPQMAHQTIEIIKIILRDPSTEMFEPLSTFFGDLTKLVVLRGDLSKLKYVIPFLQEISPIIRTYSAILDFTSVLEAITQVSSTLPYSHDQVFSRLVVHDLCSAGLEACELTSAETERSNTHFRKALVTLLCEGVFLRGADVLGELEKRRPSFIFLAKVLLPLSLTLKTTDQLASDTGKFEAWHRSSLTNSWIRLLFYAMTACQRSFRAADNLPLSRSKSRDKKNTDEKQWQAHSPTFVTALQIIKVIVIRAEAEISTTLPDLWHRLAGFLRSVLMDGNAHFALPSSNLKDTSPLPSPTPSPRGSIQLDRSGQPSFFDLPGQSTMTSGTTPLPTRLRVIDYALWSILEFLCAYRSPLRLQLRLFTIEKVATLDQELGSLQRRASPSVSPSVSPVSRRISVFAKPRRSALFPSPDSSPRTSRPHSMINELSIPSIYLGPNLSRTSHGQLSSLNIPDSNSGGQLRIPGYQYNSPTLPVSTPKRGGAYIQADGDQGLLQGPRIVHLGPASPAALLPPTPVSPGGGGSFGVGNIRLMAQSTKINSSTLMRTTCRRIRAVQAFMGYDALLPMPTSNPGIVGLGGDSDEVSFATWTKRSALEAVLNEMKDLEEEFEDIMKGSGSGSGNHDTD